MTIKVGINGYGRIGRNILRALYESGRTDEIQIVAINDLGDAKTNAHLTQYDTAHGKFPGSISVEGDYMVVNGDKIRVLSERNPAELPWAELGVEVVHESTGFFASKEKASAHLQGGAKKVIISAPGGNDVDAHAGSCRQVPVTLIMASSKQVTPLSRMLRAQLIASLRWSKSYMKVSASLAAS